MNLNREQRAYDRWLTTEPEPIDVESLPNGPDFNGWVMINEYEPGVLLQTDIETIDTDHQDAPECEGNHPDGRAAWYSLTNPEEATVLCQECIERLWANRETGRYVMGALPAN